MVNQIRDKIIETLQMADADMTMFRLKKIVAESFDEDDFSDCLAELVEAGDIIYTAKGIALKPTTLEGYILHTTAGTTKNVLLRYFNGLPVPELSTAELRALIKEIFRDRPKLSEDRYKKVFRTYAFPENVFVAVYGSNVATYRYLLHTTSKGRLDWQALRFEDNLPAETQKAIVELMRTEGLVVNGECIECTPRAIATYLVKAANGPIEESTLLEDYKRFLLENAPLPTGLEMESGAFFRMLYASENIIRHSNNAVRYRVENSVKDLAVLKKLKLGSYKNQLISADIIFAVKESVLLNANILTSHELFWLLKKHAESLAKYAYCATYCPFVKFGEATHEQQLLNLLKEMSPVTLEDLANEYQIRYGLKSSTIKVRYRAAIKQYYYDGVYDIKTRLLTNKQKTSLVSKLGNSWYYFDDVVDLFKSVIGKNYEAYLNSSNFSTLGYRETSQVVYASKYSSVEQCFRDVFLTQDIFEVEEKLWNLPQVYYMLSDHAESLDIVEYSPRKFITKKCLAKHGIHKKNLREYADLVCSAVSEEAYFTLESIKKLGVESTIEELGFDDTFYYSVLKQNKRIQGKPVAGKHIFRKTKTGKLTLPDFLEYLVVESGTIDICDFSANIEEEYGLVLDPGYIRFLIRETSLFYDNISEKIFPDYETYLEEI